MIYEQIEGFIQSLTTNIQKNTILWNRLISLQEKDKYIEEFNLYYKKQYPGHIIDPESSYFLSTNSGFVFLLNLFYVNKQLFSPSLDKKILLVKINSTSVMENLSLYADYDDSVNNLYDSVEELVYESSPSPDKLFKFMEQVLKTTSKKDKRIK